MPAMAAPSYPPGTQTAGLSQMNGAPTGMTTGVSTNPFSPYFGEPPRELKLNPYSLYGRENWALPEAYKGSNLFMTQLMITVIKDEDLWPTRVVLPIRITESEQEIAWDEVNAWDEVCLLFSYSLTLSLACRLFSTITSWAPFPRREYPASLLSPRASVRTIISGAFSLSFLRLVKLRA